MEPAEISSFSADLILLATGSYSSDTGFQKAIPHIEQLPGIEDGGFFSTEVLMARRPRLGKRVLILDEGGNW